MTAPSVVKARYEHENKAKPRDLVVELAKTGTETVLDLWGGGGSARAFMKAVPGLALVSCETDKDLWPALRVDAFHNGYAPHFGDFRSAVGKYDLVWLDLCSQWSVKAREQIVAASRMTTERGLLAVTLLAAREDSLTASDRVYTVPSSIERHTGMRVATLFPYLTTSPMWLLILRHPLTLSLGYEDDPVIWKRPSYWSLEPQWAPYPGNSLGDGMGLVPFDGVLYDMNVHGYFNRMIDLFHLLDGDE